MNSMNPLDAILGLANTVLTRVFPDKTEQEKEKFTLALQQAMMQSTLLTKQIDVNIAEAASGNVFASSWRPLVGYVCAFSFAWQFLFLPILNFIAVSAGHPIVIPVFNTDALNTVLMGMLGMGALRSFDKLNGTNS